jgi:hypothetical protein
MAARGALKLSLSERQGHEGEHMGRLTVKQCRHGSGVFAGRQIQRGEEILQFSGRLVDRGELPSPYCAVDDYYLQVGDDLFLGPSGDVDDFVNHSCDPNSGVVIADGTARLVAIRAIQSGEEITFDYSTTADQAPLEMNCLCGSPVCRGRIGDFLLLPRGLQEKYVRLGIVPDYVLAKVIGESITSRA